MRNHFSLRTVICGILLAAGSAASSQTQQTMVRLKGNISPLVAKTPEVGRTSASERIEFSIALPVTNEAELDKVIQHLYTDGDPLYHQYLRKGEFADRFGASQTDYDSVTTYVQQQGLRVMATHANRLLLVVSGSADLVEKAFNVHLINHQTANGRIFHAPDSEPALPASLAAKVRGIIGLDDSVEAEPNVGKAIPRSAGGTPKTGSGPDGYLTPSDIKTAYNLNGVTETGAGQTIALAEFDGYAPDDITHYEDYFGLPHVPLQNVLVDGYPGDIENEGGVEEVTLDIELAVALAPGATKILVYEGPRHANVNVYNRIADDDAAQQVSTSWYAGLENNLAPTFLDSENAAFKQMAAQGQSMFSSSGDNADEVITKKDADGNPIEYTFGVQDPASQPFVTTVGGTTLTTNGDGGPYQSEVVWHQNAHTGSGGGVSTEWPLPFYQSSVVSPGSGGSATNRNVPDVCLNSDFNVPYEVFLGGQWQGINGTSAATPLWAAFIARVNQGRAANGEGPLGFANPALYKIAKSARYASDFHDITIGDNGPHYSAVAGYDNCTGWGSFIGSALLSDLEKEPDVLYVDGSYTGALQDGTVTHPFKTVTAAVNAAVVFHPTLEIKGNAYPETLSISKHMVLLNNGGGHVTIGSSTNH